jgi:RNA polymerase sigma factor (sigma-70 family)
LKNCSQLTEISRRSPKTTKRARARRDRLALEHLDWARGIARHVSTTLPTWFAYEDLAGAAEIGLLQAAERWNPSHGVPFRAFAARRVHGACMDAVRRREYRERGHQTIEGIDTPSQAPNPEEIAAEGQMTMVWSRVQQLPPRHAVVILAYYGGNMSLEQLAPKMGVGSSRLSQIHREALGMLRNTLQKAA